MTALQHINIRCVNAEAARDFYVELLGLRVGPRPPFLSRGYWLYAGDDPIVHLVQKEPAGSRQPLAGALNHIAFEGTGLEATRDRLRAHNISFREETVPRDGTVQIFLTDPDGVPLELNFGS